MAAKEIDELRRTARALAMGESADEIARELGSVSSDERSIALVLATPSFASMRVRRGIADRLPPSVHIEMAPDHALSVAMLREAFGPYERGVRTSPGTDHPLHFVTRQDGAPFDITIIAHVHVVPKSPVPPVDVEKGTVTSIVLRRDPKRLPENPSDAYRSLVEQIDAMPAEEPLDEAALATIDGIERQAIIDMLRARLNARPDPRLPNALVSLFATGSEAWLQRALKVHKDPKVHVAAARALKLLGGSVEAEDVIIDVIRSGSADERIAAIEAALAFRDEKMVDALGAAALDPEPEIRYRAFLALIGYLGVPEPTSRRTIWGIAAEAIRSPVEPLWSWTLDRLGEPLDALMPGNAGAHDVTREVSPAIEAAVASDNVDALRRTEGVDRIWAELAVAARLATDRTRALRTAIAIGLPNGDTLLAALPRA